MDGSQLDPPQQLPLAEESYLLAGDSLHAGAAQYMNTKAQGPSLNLDHGNSRAPWRVDWGQFNFPSTQTCFPHRSQLLFQRALPTTRTHTKYTQPHTNICLRVPS